MNKTEKILKLYYLKHLKQVEIAKLLEISFQRVSTVVKSDARYEKEKDFRKQMNAKNRKSYLKEYFKNYKRPNAKDNTIDALRIQQKQDAIELSYNNDISNTTLAKWCQSAYKVGRSGNLVLDKNLKVPSDMPKIIFRNNKVSAQKYKGKFCFSN